MISKRNWFLFPLQSVYTPLSKYHNPIGDMTKSSSHKTIRLEKIRRLQKHISCEIKGKVFTLNKFDIMYISYAQTENQKHRHFV